MDALLENEWRKFTDKMLSKKSQRNGAHYIKDLRTTGPWRVNGIVICRKKKANKANDSDAINDSARAKSHTRNKPLLTRYKKRPQYYWLASPGN